MKIEFSNIPNTIVLDVKSISYEHYRIPEDMAERANEDYQRGVQEYLENMDSLMYRYSQKEHFLTTSSFGSSFGPHSRGGRTEVRIEIRAGDGTYMSYYGYTICSLKDNFCYAEGRRQALADAIVNILAQNRITRTKKFILEIIDQIQLCMFHIHDSDDTIVVDMQTAAVHGESQ